MSNAALLHSPRPFNTWSESRAVARILRRSTSDICPSGKKAYRTPRKARIALAAFQRQALKRRKALGQSYTVPVTYYHCPSCEHYHLTSKEQGCSS